MRQFLFHLNYRNNSILARL